MHLAARMVRDRAPPRRAARRDGRRRDRRRVRDRRRRDPAARPVLLRGRAPAARPRAPAAAATLGIAGYPEGHPLITGRRARRRVRSRRAARRLRHHAALLRPGRDPRAVAASQVELPVIVGLPGIVDRRKLLEISMRVGVGPSLSYLRKQRGLRNLLRLSASSPTASTTRSPRATRSPASTSSPSTGSSRRGAGPATSELRSTPDHGRRSRHDATTASNTCCRRRQPGRAGAQLADRPVRLPEGRRRVHELARRAGRVARDRRALRPVAPHDRPLHRRARTRSGCSPPSA